MNEHHTQRLDFGENGYLIATRDDTAEIQDLRLKAFLRVGPLIRERRVVYNIQYDYYREQEWKSGELIGDSLGSREGYGHLQWEFALLPPERWSEENPYPDNYEPVKPAGCDMFHLEGYKFGALLLENKVEVAMNCYIYDDLEEQRKQNLNLVTDAHVMSDLEKIERIIASESEDLKKNPFNPEQARKKRLEFLESYSKVIGVAIPYDSRFID